MFSDDFITAGKSIFQSDLEHDCAWRPQAWASREGNLPMPRPGKGVDAVQVFRII